MDPAAEPDFLGVDWTWGMSSDVGGVESLVWRGLFQFICLFVFLHLLGESEAYWKNLLDQVYLYPLNNWFCTKHQPIYRSF